MTDKQFHVWLKVLIPLFIASVFLLFAITLLAGCEYIPAFGAGVATNETLQSWQDNLEAKQLELQTAYAAAEKAIAEAPDPNALALAVEKRDSLREPMLINEAVLITLQSALAAKQEKSGSAGRQDAIFTGVIGLIGLAYQQWSRNTLNKKYTAGKIGQAKLKLENPTAEKKLYALTGEARRTLGL